MSAVSDADLLNTVYTVAPEFTTMNDSDVLQVMDLAKLFVSENKFGKFYPVALADYTAHLLTLRAETANSGGMSATLTSGGIVSESEGDLSRSYGAANTGGAGNDLLNKTVYGKAYLQLLKLVIVPVRTRMG